MISTFDSTAATVLFAFVACAHLTFAVPLSYIDVREHRLPNKLTLALNGAVACTAATAALIAPSLTARVLGACALSLVVGVIACGFALLSPGSIGMGDAKVTPATVLLAALGGMPILLGALAWLCGAGAFAALWVLLRTRSTKTRFAFGPIILSAPYGGLALSLLGLF
ncbi:prepilin peptidase [Dermabacter sp. p3-SID358]|uniref:prepilin peptidase n=1 Tax=Dermabacter sp. p3-SID358 TaxID=2916114 RepID=UPI0021A511F6|nr:prepilin peptidase [Dermabacter sp. p3-SID358]MCT1866039.1 prepilin peptidase [Dermabacter sp. p3-SID358]